MSALRISFYWFQATIRGHSSYGVWDIDFGGIDKMKLAALSLVLLPFFIATIFAHTGARESQASRSFSVDPGTLLFVDVSRGDLDIMVWPRNEIAVQFHGITAADGERVLTTQMNNEVRLEFKPPRRWGRSGSIRFEIHLPSQTNLDLRTSGGNIRIEGPLAGTLKSSTSGGDITLPDISGDIDASTSGGDIRAGNLGASAELRTSGGDINLLSATGDAVLMTSGGDIRAGDIGGSLNAKTSGGDVSVGDVKGSAKVLTSGGDIDLGNVSNTVSLVTSGGDITLRRATGTITVKSSGGDLKMEHVSGTLDAKTSGGDIRAELEPGPGDSRLVTAGGNVTLFLPQSSPATVEARIRIEGSWEKRSQKYDIHADFTADNYEKDAASRDIRARYTLNGGGPEIRLETVNGNIEIRSLESVPR